MRQLFALLTLAFLSIFVLSGCITDTSQHPLAPDVYSAIHDTKSAVALVTNLGAADENQTYCSANWISATKILTAAHCVEGYASIVRQQAVVAALVKSGIPEFLANMMAASADDFDNMDMDNPLIPSFLKEAAAIIKAVPPVPQMGLHMAYTIPADVNDPGYRPNRVYGAVAIAVNNKADLALLQTEGVYPNHNIPVLAEHSPRVGETVHSMGTPDHLFFTYHSGLVTGYRGSLDRAGMDTVEGPFMQVRMGISPGDSGSVVFDQDDRIVGLSSFVDTESGAGFCIHLETIRGFLIGQRVIKGKIDPTAKDPDLTNIPLNLH